MNTKTFIIVCLCNLPKRKGMCTSHRIRNQVVKELLLEELKQITAFAKNHEEKFAQVVFNKF